MRNNVFYTIVKNSLYSVLYKNFIIIILFVKKLLSGYRKGISNRYKLKYFCLQPLEYLNLFVNSSYVKVNMFVCYAYWYFNEHSRYLCRYSIPLNA